MPSWARAVLSHLGGRRRRRPGGGRLPATAAPAAAPAAAQGRSLTRVHGMSALVPSETQAPVPPSPNARTALPSSVDLTVWAVPVGDQGAVNSCVAWAIGYGLQGV